MVRGHIQRGTIITQSIFSRILKKDTPWFAREGKVWGVFCEFEVCYTLYCCRYIDKLDHVITAPYYIEPSFVHDKCKVG